MHYANEDGSLGTSWPASPAAVILLRRVEADPLGAAAEEHRGVVDAQLGARGVAARAAHEAVHGGARVLLVCSSQHSEGSGSNSGVAFSGGGLTALPRG
jgi:hypothetical protein